MSGHNDYLSKVYSNILKEKLQEQETLKEISDEQMGILHDTLATYFGILPDEGRIRKSMERIIEAIVKEILEERENV